MYAPIRRFIKHALYSPDVILYDNICFDENGNVRDQMLYRYGFSDIASYLNQIDSGDFRPSRLIKYDEVEINNVVYNRYIKQDWYSDGYSINGNGGYSTDNQGGPEGYAFYFLIRKDTPFYNNMKASVNGITALNGIIMNTNDNQILYQSATGVSGKCQFIVDFGDIPIEPQPPTEEDNLQPGLYVEQDDYVAPVVYSDREPPFDNMTDYLNQWTSRSGCIKLNRIGTIEIGNTMYDTYQEQVGGSAAVPSEWINTNTYLIAIPSSIDFSSETQAVVSGTKNYIPYCKLDTDNSIMYSCPRNSQQSYFLVAYVE